MTSCASVLVAYDWKRTSVLFDFQQKTLYGSVVVAAFMTASRQTGAACGASEQPD
jgi:hypothetical protein